MSISIVTLCVLSLLQCAVGEPRPDFALEAIVVGTTRVQDSTIVAGVAVSAVVSELDAFVIVSELELFQEVADIVADIAYQFHTIGQLIVNSVDALATDGGGVTATPYGGALDAINELIAFSDDTLPGLKDQLVPLVGSALPDKFLDSFEHIGKALQALLVSVTELEAAAESALTEAGVAIVPADIVRRHIRPSMVSQLVYAMNLLKGTVPVLEYTVESTLENIAIGDEFMLALDSKVDSTIGASSELAEELDGIIDQLDSTIGMALGGISEGLDDLASGFADLANLGTASSSGALGTVLGDFQANLAGLALADPSILTVLNQLKGAISDAYDVVDHLYYIYESPLVDALMTTLVANGDYSQYCFYKYKDFFFVLLDTISAEASACIGKEIERLEYYQGTIGLMFEILFYDFVDIPDHLDICEAIDDEANLEECTAKFVEILADLEEAFSAKVMLGYNSLQHEIAASSNRLKICIRLTQSELQDTESPVLMQKINDCAAEGPYAEDD